MAATFTIDQSGDSSLNVALAGGWWLVGGSIALSSSYSTGGESVDLTKAFGSGGSLRRVIPLGTARGLGMEYDKTNKKLKFTITDVTSNTVAEHSAAAYDSDITASAIDVAFLVKFG